MLFELAVIGVCKSRANVSHASELANVRSGSKLAFEMTVIVRGTADADRRWLKSLQWGKNPRPAKSAGGLLMAHNGSATGVSRLPLLGA